MRRRWTPQFPNWKARFQPLNPDAQSVDPDLDVITMAVKVPQTLAHLHYWSVRMPRNASRDEVLDAFRASSRIALIKMSEGLGALNAVKEMMADLGRPNDSLYEVALWEDMLTVEGDELFYAYMVDNQAIVIPETIDAIRALTEAELQEWVRSRLARFKVPREVVMRDELPRNATGKILKGQLAAEG